jgi:hypothetical protein
MFSLRSHSGEFVKQNGLKHSECPLSRSCYESCGLPVAEKGSRNLMAGIEYTRDGCGIEGWAPLSGHEQAVTNGCFMEG